MSLEHHTNASYNFLNETRLRLLFYLSKSSIPGNERAFHTLTQEISATGSVSSFIRRSGLSGADPDKIRLSLFEIGYYHYSTNQLNPDAADAINLALSEPVSQEGVLDLHFPFLSTTRVFQRAGMKLSPYRDEPAQLLNTIFPVVTPRSAALFLEDIIAHNEDSQIKESGQHRQLNIITFKAMSDTIETILLSLANKSTPDPIISKWVNVFLDFSERLPVEPTTVLVKNRAGIEESKTALSVRSQWLQGCLYKNLLSLALRNDINVGTVIASEIITNFINRHPTTLDQDILDFVVFAIDNPKAIEYGQRFVDSAKLEDQLAVIDSIFSDKGRTVLRRLNLRERQRNTLQQMIEKLIDSPHREVRVHAIENLIEWYYLYQEGADKIIGNLKQNPHLSTDEKEALEETCMAIEKFTKEDEQEREKE